MLEGKGDKGSYVPRIYTKSQTLYVDQFFGTNGYIGTLPIPIPPHCASLTPQAEYSKLKSLGIRNPQGHAQKLGDGVSLASCYAGKALFEQVNASLEDALSEDGEGFIDVMVSLYRWRGWSRVI
jgi:hypothetical protein